MSHRSTDALLAACIKRSRQPHLYGYGAGHGVALSRIPSWSRLDCSSSSCLVLHDCGLWASAFAATSGVMESHWEPGRGKRVTVHASRNHVWIEFTLYPGDLFYRRLGPYARFDTSPHGSGPAPGCGWGMMGPKLRLGRRSTESFVSRHPAGH